MGLASQKLLDSTADAKKQLELILKDIGRLARSVDDQGASCLRQAKFFGLLEKLSKDCQALRKKDLEGEQAKAFFEFVDHVRQQQELIGKIKSSDQVGSVVKAKPLRFRVEQWDKAKADTFFLGDKVGCCLATDGSQFPAIVQRRLDDAMLFHVAINAQTGEPMALGWLYLTNNYLLIANFFEVQTELGLCNDHRRALLYGLLKFTEQYLQDNPAIEGFLSEPT